MKNNYILTLIFCRSRGRQSLFYQMVSKRAWILSLYSFRPSPNHNLQWEWHQRWCKILYAHRIQKQIPKLSISILTKIWKISSKIHSFLKQCFLTLWKQGTSAVFSMDYHGKVWWKVPYFHKVKIVKTLF